jgi:hypothetical protein
MKRVAVLAPEGSRNFAEQYRNYSEIRLAAGLILFNLSSMERRDESQTESPA